jgi:hypothetical protein
VELSLEKHCPALVLRQKNTIPASRIWQSLLDIYQLSPVVDSFFSVKEK